MLRVRSHLLSAVRAASPLPAASSLYQLLLCSTAAKSTAPFVAEEYLATTCGLTPAQAIRSSKFLAHLKSPSRPDAVLAFLADIGLAKADVAAAIARDPRFLCSKVDKTVAPRVAQLRDIGLSPAQISRLISVAPTIFTVPGMIPRLEFYLSFLGSYEKVHTAIRRSIFLLSGHLERVVKPNMAFLRQCGLIDCDIAKLHLIAPGILASKPERVKEIVVCADKLGVPRDSAMFKHALRAIYWVSPLMIAARLDLLKKALGCSEAQLGIAIGKFPYILTLAEGKLGRMVELLKFEVGLDAEYIVHRPTVLTYSVKGRLMPRHYVLKVLKEKGLVKKDVDFVYMVSQSEKKFIKRFLDPYKASVPGLADAYVAACAGHNHDSLKWRHLLTR